MQNVDLNSSIALDVLGTLLVEPMRFYEVQELLRPCVFPHEYQGLAEIVINSLSDSGQADAKLIASKAKDLGYNPSLVTGLVYDHYQPDHLEAYTVQLHKDFTSRSEQARLQAAITALTKGDEPEQVLNALEAAREAEEQQFGSKHWNAAKIYKSVMDRLVASCEKGNGTGPKSCFPSMDNITGGYVPGDYIVIGARPGMGKTSFVLQMALEAAQAGIGVVFHTLEMDEFQIISKAVGMLCGIPYSKIKRGDITMDEMHQISAMMDEMRSLPLVFETSCYNERDLVNRTRYWNRRMKGAVGLVIVDYLQKVDASVKNPRRKDLEVGSVSWALRKMAKADDCETCVIALSQLSRASESRDDKRPRISDLRESGQIEQDATNIFGLYRDAYYNPSNSNTDSELICLKDRADGRNIGRTIFFGYDDKHETFVDYEDGAEPTKDDPIIRIDRNKRNGDEDIPF